MSGVLHGVVASLKAAATAATDAFFKYVSLLLNTSATNGAQNNTFLDSSTNAFSVTRNGNTTQGTFSPFSQTGWSNYFDGTGDYLTIPANAAFQFGTGDFTIECWINKPAAANGPIVDARGSAVASPYAFYIDGSNFPYFYDGTSYTSTVAIVNNQWNHVAVVKTSGALKIFVNGVEGYSAAYSTALNPLQTIYIGGQNFSTPVYTTGYISNLRIVKGTAVYTSNFTPPTAPLTAITNTSLLTCQSNRFIDNSSNNFTITRNGDVSVQAFSPFNPTSAWSASTNGGSGYFDGTGDYLSAASDAAFALPAAFTFEVWLWPVVFNQTVSRGDTIFASIATAGLTVGRTDSGTGNRWGVAESNVAWRLTTTTLPTNAMWNHMVAVRDSSNNMALFLNGTRVANATVTTSFAQNAITIGSDNNQTGSYITGYMSGMRLVKGTAVYDPTLTTLTVPTAPLTAITNTSLLLNFINAGIYDSASGNDLETSGNAQASTTQAKFGTTSMKFAGGSDWMQTVTKPALRFGTAPFTIEAWLYPTSAATMCVTSIYTGTAGWTWKISGNVIAWYDNTSGNIGGTAAIASNTWTHVAIVREGTGANQFKFYVNGVLDVTSTCSANFTQTANCFVGGEGGATPNFATSVWNGYIDDLRITNGVARYTANFTPPTAAFPLN